MSLPNDQTPTGGRKRQRLSDNGLSKRTSDADHPHSSDEDLTPKKKHLTACVEEFLGDTTGPHTVDAFVAGWSSLRCNAASTHISQVGPLVCPSRGNMEQFLQQQAMLSSPTREIVALPAEPMIPRHHLCGLVLKPPIEPTTPVPQGARYFPAGGPTLAPARLTEDGWEGCFDLALWEAVHKSPALYGLLAEPTVERAVTRIPGAVFVHLHRSLFRVILHHALGTVFTHRPLRDTEYVIDWAFFHYCILGEPPTDTPPDIFSTPPPPREVLVCDNVGHAIRRVELSDAQSPAPLPVTWSNASCKTQVLHGYQLADQQRRQKFGAAHALHVRWAADVTGRSVHAAVVLRIMSREARTKAPYQVSYAAIVDAASGDALALAAFFPGCFQRGVDPGAAGGPLPRDHRRP